MTTEKRQIHCVSDRPALSCAIWLSRLLPQGYTSEPGWARTIKVFVSSKLRGGVPEPLIQDVHPRCRPRSSAGAQQPRYPTWSPHLAPSRCSDGAQTAARTATVGAGFTSEQNRKVAPGATFSLGLNTDSSHLTQVEPSQLRPSQSTDGPDLRATTSPLGQTPRPRDHR